MAEADQMLRNLSSILDGINSSFNNILKLVLYFENMKRDFLPVNEVLNLYIPENSPARSSIGVAALPRGARVVVDCLAAINLKRL